MAKSEVREKATLTPPERKPPRFGMAADGTSSPAGLIIKIVVLGLVLGIAVWAAFPLMADQPGSGWRRWSWSPRSCSTSTCHRAGSRRST